MIHSDLSVLPGRNGPCQCPWLMSPVVFAKDHLWDCRLFLIRLIIVSVFFDFRRLKSYQLLLSPALARYWFQQPVFQILGIELELLVGFLLFSGWPAHWMARIRRRLSGGIGGDFGFDACLGRIQLRLLWRWAVHPSLTLSFNLAAIVGLSPFWRKGEWSAQPLVSCAIRWCLSCFWPFGAPFWCLASRASSRSPADGTPFEPPNGTGLPGTRSARLDGQTVADP